MDLDNVINACNGIDDKNSERMQIKSNTCKYNNSKWQQNNGVEAEHIIRESTHQILYHPCPAESLTREV